MSAHKALTGIRIIDLSMGWAGPLATRHMADMGAQVIKIESCERFDWWRSWEATPEWIADNGAEKSTAFNMVNRNKQNVTLDLEQPKGKELLLKLVSTAHAVVENYSSGVLPKLGLGFEVFKQVKDDIVLLSMPAFGASGPWQYFRAYGSTVEQSSGLPHLNGNADDPPTMQHVAYGDAVGGLTGASALLVALRHQAKTGNGQFVDLSQVEGLLPLAAHGILEFTANGRSPTRQGNRRDDIAPHGVFPCAGDDSWIVIQAFTEQQWLALQAMASPTLDDFTSLADRLERREELDTRIGAWTKRQHSQRLMHKLQEAKIPAAATHSATTLLTDEHLEARNYWQWRDRVVVGKQPNPSAPYRAGKDPIPIVSPAPTLGQHNNQILGELLGLSPETLAQLQQEGIIGTQPRMPKSTR